MTKPRVRLDPTVVTVEPGGQATSLLTITNSSRIVEGYRVRIVDEGMGPGVRTWTSLGAADGAGADPNGFIEVAVYPDQQQAITLTFAPPPRSAPSGRFAFGVHVTSVVNPADSDVVEGEVEVGGLFDLQSRIVPVNSTGRWRGRHTVTVSNWGNAPARVGLVGSDPDELLGYLIRPSHITLAAGASVTARVNVRTRRPRLRGQDARLPFTVAAEPDPPASTDPGGAPQYPGLADPRRPVVQATFTQRPILSRGTVAAAVLATAALVGAAVFALTRARPDPAATEGGVPPTPVLTAAPGGAAEIQLSWAPVPSVNGYKLLHLASDSTAVEKTQDLDASLGVLSVRDLTPGARRCFQLVANRADASSPPSEAACANAGAAPQTNATTTPTPSSNSTTSPPTTPPGNSTTTPPPIAVPTFSSTDRIVMVYVRPYAAADADTETSVLKLRDALVERGAKAQLLKSTDFPRLRPALAPSYVVYLGPYQSDTQALGDCARLKDNTGPFEDCVVASPAP